MEEAFHPQSMTINELFGNQKALYQIPQYQRAYKWIDEQVDQLWSDLNEAWESEDEESQYYFLGSIITAKPPKSNGYLDIVDGQQRITTLMILLCVYRDMYPSINENGTADEAEESDPDIITISTIRNAINRDGRTNRLRFYTQSQHLSFFENAVLKEGSSTQWEKPHKADLAKDEEPQYKFKNTAFIFREKLKEIGEAHAGQFLNFIFNKVKVIRIDCHSVGSAIRLFQVLNDRGLDLSNSDILKSSLMLQIEDIYAKEDIPTRTAQFLADWQFCETTASSTDMSLNDLFVLYAYYRLEKNPRHSWADELKNKLKKEDPTITIADFKTFCTNYKKNIHESNDTVIFSLKYLRWSMYWRSILLAALQHDRNDYNEIKNALRRFYYLFWIAGGTLSSVKQVSFNLIRMIREGWAFEEINKVMEDRLNRIYWKLPGALTGSVYHEAWCKPLLFILEYEQVDNSKEQAFLGMNNRNIHVEHIVPDKFEKFTEWDEFKHVSAFKREFLNSFGNLTLLSGTKNIEASNNPFHVKISVYRGNGLHGDKDEKVTAFDITKKIVTDFDQGKYSQKWTVQSMIDRWNWFKANIEKVLKINVYSQPVVGFSENPEVVEIKWQEG